MGSRAVLFEKRSTSYAGDRRPQFVTVGLMAVPELL
jgi:hypothetical protein